MIVPLSLKKGTILLKSPIFMFLFVFIDNRGDVCSRLKCFLHMLLGHESLWNLDFTVLIVKDALGLIVNQSLEVSSIGFEHHAYFVNDI